MVQAVVAREQFVNCEPFSGYSSLSVAAPTETPTKPKPAVPETVPDNPVQPSPIRRPERGPQTNPAPGKDPLPFCQEKVGATEFRRAD